MGRALGMGMSMSMSMGYGYELWTLIPKGLMVSGYGTMRY